MKIFLMIAAFISTISASQYTITHSPLKDENLLIKDFHAGCESEVFERYETSETDKGTFKFYLSQTQEPLTYKELKDKRNNLLESLENEDVSNNLRVAFQGPTMPLDMFLYGYFCEAQQAKLEDMIKMTVGLLGIMCIVLLGLMFFPSFIKKEKEEQ